MKERVSQLLEAEGLSASKFAEIMGIQPSGVSHILSGRNMPGFEFITRLLSKFPRISPDWLLMGIEPMYRNGDSGEGESMIPEHDEREGSQTALEFDSEIDKESSGNGVNEPDISKQMVVDVNSLEKIDSNAAQQQSDDELENIEIAPRNVRGDYSALNIIPDRDQKIERVMIFYSDGTVATYHPEYNPRS